MVNATFVDVDLAPSIDGELRAILQGEGLAEEQLPMYDLSLRSEKGGLKVNLAPRTFLGMPRIFWVHHLRLRLSVLVPQSVDEQVLVRCTSGNITVAGLSAAELIAETRSGDVMISDCAVVSELKATSASGDVTVEHTFCKGDCDLHASSGDIKLYHVVGAGLRARTGSGDVAWNIIKVMWKCSQPRAM